VKKKSEMKEIIQAFLDQKKIAVAGASTNKDNFGRMLMTELVKRGYEVYPVNPLYEEVEGVRCVPTIKELPADVQNLILAVPPRLTEEIVGQCDGSPIKRVWMHRSMGQGAESDAAKDACRQQNIGVVYGFCPMMFYGKGMHRFHLWIRKRFGKVPSEYLN